MTLAMLRRNLPELKSEPGEHYADILTTLYKRCLREIHEAAEAEPKQRKVNGAMRAACGAMENCVGTPRRASESRDFRFASIRVGKWF